MQCEHVLYSTMGLESESEPVPKSVSVNVNGPLHDLQTCAVDIIDLDICEFWVEGI